MPKGLSAPGFRLTLWPPEDRVTTCVTEGLFARSALISVRSRSVSASACALALAASAPEGGVSDAGGSRAGGALPSALAGRQAFLEPQATRKWLHLTPGTDNECELFSNVEACQLKRARAPG